MKSDDDPLRAANAAPRCTARSKRTGLPCKAPAVKGWNVCRMHGARGGHKAGPSHPSWKHGMRSKAWEQSRKSVDELSRHARSLVAESHQEDTKEVSR